MTNFTAPPTNIDHHLSSAVKQTIIDRLISVLNNLSTVHARV